MFYFFSILIYWISTPLGPQHGALPPHWQSKQSTSGPFRYLHTVDHNHHQLWRHCRMAVTLPKSMVRVHTMLTLSCLGKKTSDFFLRKWCFWDLLPPYATSPKTRILSLHGHKNSHMLLRTCVWSTARTTMSFWLACDWYWAWFGPESTGNSNKNQIKMVS